MELHPGCVLCKKRNVAKHDIIDDESGRILVRKGDFAIKCDGIPANPEEHLISIIDPLIRKELGGDETIREIARMRDPVLWAEDNLLVVNPETKEKEPWKPQGATPENVEKYGLSPDALYYQEIMAKCTARRNIFRIGRRSGKTWTLIAKVLHQMFINEGYRILVITPVLAQMDIIFSTAREFIRSSPTLNSGGIRYIKTPQRYLELPNGSFMRGFVSGNESIRGQAADMIVIDEGDYLTTDDISAISAILTEHKDTVLCVSSTPSGAREAFYKWDNDPVYRSFHFPSMCRPLWDEEMEIEQKKETPGVKYKHEILAEYGEIEEGVFQHEHIDEALEEGDYTYSDTLPSPGWIYTMGVDWNPVNGTEVYIIGCDTSRRIPAYKVVDHGEVFREGNTQVQAVNEIIRLNRKWNPSAIYVDRGAGSMQIEYLNEFGKQAAPNTPDKRLEEIVEAVDFGSKIEVRNPADGKIQKVYAKPAVVENAIRAFEGNQVILSKYDVELIRQLRGYIVDKIAVNGRPTYKMVSDEIKDHRLDAFILSLFAFTMKFTKMGQPEIIPIVRFTARPGEDTIRESERREKKPNSRSIFKEDEEELDEDTEQSRKEGLLKPSEIRDGSQIGYSSPFERISEQANNRRRISTRSTRIGPMKRGNIR